MIWLQIGAWNISIIKHYPVQVTIIWKGSKITQTYPAIDQFIHCFLAKSFTSKYFVQRSSLLKPLSCCNTSRRNTLSMRMLILEFKYFGKFWPLVDHSLHTSFVWLHYLQNWSVYFASQLKTPYFFTSCSLQLHLEQALRIKNHSMYLVVVSQWLHSITYFESIGSFVCFLSVCVCKGVKYFCLWRNLTFFCLHKAQKNVLLSVEQTWNR